MTRKLRYERKYLVHNSKLDSLRLRMMPFIEPDSYANLYENQYPEYTVRSIYFDSFQMDALNEKIAGVELRKKLRIRGYDSYTGNNKVFLEIKKKDGNRIYKNRALIPFSKTKDFLLYGPDEELKQKLASKKQLEDAMRFMFHYKKRNLAPVNLIVYDREAYHGKFNHELRITFDKNIRSCYRPDIDDLYDDQKLKYVWDNHFILEVKYFFPPMPGWVKTIVEDFKLETQALSKYTEGYFCHNLHVKTAI